ncbi:hypothetical protein [Neotabrizicola shimadae]|uniref:Uncharacterized protein n=1 Tax=Neotabrizicola shimadae TaxID=2807096 RepID=A0A8G0ZS93_9RHOB|nr:hypothetical protein [Neotabrizicola shimadae]QYZ68540.1 hypothetical protein JO391_12180 [Neotabrizicola shimadae]
MLLEPSTQGKAYVLLAIAVHISGWAYAAWAGRSVIVTDRRLVYHAALSRFVRSVPLDKIEQVEQEPGRVVVRAGTAFNTMTLSVPAADALASALEAARASALLEPPVRSEQPTLPKGKRSEPSRSEKVLGYTVLGVIGLGILMYNLPDQAQVAKKSAGNASQPTASLSAEPNDAASSPTDVTVAAVPMEVAPVQSRVSDTINTSALMDCWMGAIRGAYGWIQNEQDRTGDSLARFFGKGGIAVKVVVIGNRIDISRLELAGVTGPGAKPLGPEGASDPNRLDYWEAQDVYTTAVRAISRCGIAEVPLPNGTFNFIFDPSRNDIPVQPIGG